MTKRKLGLLIPLLITAIAFTYAIPAHIIDGQWPPHARNHVFQSLIWIVGFCLVSAMIVLKLEKYGLWAWWYLLFSGIFIFWGYFIPILSIAMGGAPGIGDDILFSTLGIIYFFTLFRLKKYIV